MAVFHIHEAYKTSIWLLNLIMVTVIILVFAVVIDKTYSLIRGLIRRTKMARCVICGISNLDTLLLDFCGEDLNDE